MRLAHPRPIVSLQLSPSGKHLISVTPTSIHILQTAHLQRGFAETLESEERLTTLAFHPSEDYFATGDVRGRIRFWYGALSGSESEGLEEEKKEVGGGRPATAVFHWHAHAVSSLSFTPNGAYLLSGGEEAVMVLWQLHTSHQEFVPRLGAPILSLAITGEQRADGGEQVVAARLRDGTTVFIGVQKLKISRTIAGIKADPPAATRPSTNKQHLTPLALLPTTSTSTSSTTLVLPSSHPSSLQFYQPSTDTQSLELEISPSNRVSAAGEKPLEPTRVQLVAFSQPEEKRGAGGYWMATVDSWQNGGFREQQRLKFWWKKAGTGAMGEETSFSLTTRIDSPHSSSITSLSFSPSTTTFSPLLLTTSLDGLIKLWSLTPTPSAQNQTWSCRSSLTYRSFLPLSSSFSTDGSMFAIAHSRSVTLWSTRTLGLIKAFACESVKPVTKVTFGGEEGETLLAGGEHGVLGWSLLDFEESFSLSFPVASLTSKPNSSTIIATEKPTSTTTPTAASSSPSTSNDGASTSTAFIIHAPSPSSTTTTRPSVSTRQLPFPVTTSLWLPTPPTSSTSAQGEEELSLAALSPGGSISLLGAASRVGQQILPTRLPTAGQRGKGMSRLFDEIFGGEEEKTPVLVRKANKAEEGKGKGKKLESQSANGLLEETPAHVLPPVRLLWREMLGGYKVAPTTSSAEGEKMVVGAGEDEAAGNEQKEEEEAASASNVVFAPSQAEELSKVFGERLLLSSPKKSPSKQLSGTPKSGKKGKH
ncbi:WD40-repeat-containing domain protein [Leucosporidium creatinivorum]|uniref:WD40-repeat-containing domain protein n=1 Tax=Leucosporidium creatinivorum TaxID=106004 RepID=A0A1Y2F5H9_9BASI|nr:WD40-repeat-containing domain protein [Leucosporidium creatinivorum]